MLTLAQLYGPWPVDVRLLKIWVNFRYLCTDIAHFLTDEAHWARMSAELLGMLIFLAYYVMLHN